MNKKSLPVALLLLSAGYALPALAATSGCKGIAPKACLAQAIDAMGGKQKLASIQSERLDVIGHTALMEQSYRQSPFITSYERDKITLDFARNRLLDEQHSVWPESDLNAADSDVTLVVAPEGGAYRFGKNSAPCSAADLDSAAQTLALGPERLLLLADAASDLHYQPDETLRATPHTVLAFQWNGIPVRILLSSFTHLPDAVDTTQTFRDFWYFWGDVHQRIYWDNWKLIHGVVYPTNQITERNGSILSSQQILNADFNPSLDDKQFAVDPQVAQRSKASTGWDRPFKPGKPTELAPGITLYTGSWNATIIRQDDGIVLLETPISGTYAEGIFAQAQKLYPALKIKAVLSTSDSWPHVGGIRYDVAQNVPVYILDLNQPLLDRMLVAPHTLHPDALQTSPRKPRWKIVSAKTEIGTGDNRVVLYPLRGASTERQYMAWFPKYRLLYTSDTLVLNQDGSLYDPELMREVKLAVDREHLDVETVYAMHQDPTPWNKVTEELKKAES